MTSAELKHLTKQQEWAAQIQNCRSSGLPVRAWCRQEGIGFPLNPNAKGVLFVYMADGNFKTSTDQLLAVCGVLNGPDNEWACLNPALQNTLPIYYEICVAANLYLQDKGLYDEYLAMDEYTILEFMLDDDDELIAEKIVL